MSAIIKRNAFASYDTTQVTTPSGFTLELRDEVTARETFTLLKRMQEPDETFANYLCGLFVQGWDIELEDGSVAAVAPETLDEMSFRVRREIQEAVDKHAKAYLAAILPDLTEESDGPLDETSPKKAKKPRATRA